MEDVITVKEAEKIAQEAFNRGYRHGVARGHLMDLEQEDRENQAFNLFCKKFNLNPRDI